MPLQKSILCKINKYLLLFEQKSTINTNPSKQMQLLPLRYIFLFISQLSHDNALEQVKHLVSQIKHAVVYASKYPVIQGH